MASIHTTKINFTSYFPFDVFLSILFKNKIFLLKNLFLVAVDEALRVLDFS
jgi:hypothetical protein